MSEILEGFLKMFIIVTLIWEGVMCVYLNMMHNQLSEIRNAQKKELEEVAEHVEEVAEKLKSNRNLSNNPLYKKAE